MTVGIAAACGVESQPRVILAADRLVTTRQHSAIEHEHPEAKLEQLAESYGEVHAIGIVSGSIALGDELTQRINRSIPAVLQNSDVEGLDGQLLADISAHEYRELLREKVQNTVLSRYGLELDDLSKQHQFKDDFFTDVMAEVQNVADQVYRHLTLLIGCVDEFGTHIFEITNGDITMHNRLGYAAIGSGKQPAISEFIQAQYSASENFENGIATTIAAVTRSRQASGVGEHIDLGIVSQDGATEVDDETIGDLVDRQETIDRRQENAKGEVLSEQTIHVEVDP